MIRFVTVFVLSLFAVGAWAQTSPPQHQHAVDVTVVDGAKNPELIPDSTAYRLWLVTVSLPANATDQQRTFQHAHLSKVQLNDGDYAALVSILTDFKNQYLSMISQYNESSKATLLKGAQPDQKTFLQQRDNLVAFTRILIKQRLSPNGADRVEGHVQHEKHGITIHTTGDGVQP